MIQQHQNKFNWRKTLSALALGLGAIAFMKFPATATPNKTQDSFKLAQVGFRSNLNSSTPLNITPPPGTHIPLPASNYHHRRHNYNYREYQRSPLREYVQYRHSRSYGRRKPCYNDYYYPQRSRYHNKGRGVIIINPGSYSTYSNNSSYIRVIRR